MIKSKDELKSYFETGDKPTQAQYADLIDSFVDAKQPESTTNRRFVINRSGDITLQEDITFASLSGNFYDEGGWTPQVSVETEPGTSGNPTAKYTRVGNLVHFSISVAGVTTPNEEGFINISLPPGIPAIDIGAVQVSLAKNGSTSDLAVIPDERILEGRCDNDKIILQDKYGRSIYVLFNNAQLMISGTYMTNLYALGRPNDSSQR